MGQNAQTQLPYIPLADVIDPPVTDVQPAAVVRLGVDYSVARPTRAALDGVGAIACFRYASSVLGPTNPKNISRAEAQQLRSWGKHIGIYWENDINDALLGRAAGQDMASYAADFVANAGGPSDGGVIFASCDIDARFDQVAAWYEGWASRRPAGRRGGYGSHAIIKGLFDHGLIDFGAQTRAWSVDPRTGQVVWDPRAQVQQYASTSLADGSQVDLLRLTQANYGQWGANMTLTQADINAVTEAIHADVAAMLSDPNHQYLPPLHRKLNDIARALAIDTAAIEAAIARVAPAAGVDPVVLTQAVRDTLAQLSATTNPENGGPDSTA